MTTCHQDCISRPGGAEAPPGHDVSTPVGSGRGKVGYQGVRLLSGGLGGSFRGAKAPPGCAVSTPVGSGGGKVGYRGVRLLSGGLGGSFHGAKASPGRAVSTPVGSRGGKVGYQGAGLSSGGLGGSFRGAKASPGCAVSTPVGSIGGGCLSGGKQVALYADVVSSYVGGGGIGGGCGDVGYQVVRSSIGLEGSYSGGSRQVESRPKMVGISLGGMKKAEISSGGRSLSGGGTWRVFTLRVAGWIQKIATSA